MCKKTDNWKLKIRYLIGVKHVTNSMSVADLPVRGRPYIT